MRTHKINFLQGTKDQILEDSDEAQALSLISNKISELFDMKNICFLFGSGTSAGAIPTMKEMFKAVEDKIETLEVVKREFYQSITLQQPENLEELLGILYASRHYLSSDSLKKDLLDICNELISIVEEVIFVKINIDINDSTYADSLDLYKSFYLKVAHRNKDLSRISIFTTNNDLFNEFALDNLNISYINGFNGGISRFFNPAFFNYTYSKRMDTSIEKYEPIENLVYLYKIHGSVNWYEDLSNANTFFKIKEETSVSNLVYSKDKNTLIYPTPTKQNKSLGSPYTEMFREFQKKLLEPHTVLFVVGYSFSDEHVNNIIYQALATNTTVNLVIINHLTASGITTIDDNRIFKIYGEIGGGEKIHYFKYIVENLIPDINMFKDENAMLETFIKKLKKS
ncbi:hypothetical protein HIO71_03220 [Chryseobacterium aquaticum]|uniref:SIR2-like domain-containing protein n=1 Tax=Chryseobacterium aquaticum TaxID=452084 RepID=A0A848N2X5_9FLAO|nr:MULTISPECIES: SIR2 family protein [Chryseobacterium]NMR33215.1 hypothetical protein [Chryseobacterium aquaticum]NRQ44853.1 SIR2 family protein [Chryseobacterium sp. C-204]